MATGAIAVVVNGDSVTEPGERCSVLAMSIYTLRYYERIGLIKQIPRLSSGRRRYSRETAGQVESLGYLRVAVT